MYCGIFILLKELFCDIKIVLSPPHKPKNIVHLFKIIHYFTLKFCMYILAAYTILIFQMKAVRNLKSTNLKKYVLEELLWWNLIMLIMFYYYVDYIWLRMYCCLTRFVLFCEQMTGYDNQGYLDENNLNESRARPRGRPVAPPRHNVPYTSNVDLMVRIIS